MKPAIRLNSFPVIAVAALFLASLMGLGIGFASLDKPSPTIQQGDVDMVKDGQGSGGGPLGDLPRGGSDGTDWSNKSGDGNGRNGNSGGNTRSDPTETGTDGNNGGGETTGPIKAGEPRKLPDGRVDEVVTVLPIKEATCAIQVSVTDTRGNRLPFALLALDVNSGPLGWHGVPQQPKNVPEERGVFRFEQLFPGEYRIRSLAANYKAQEHSVRLTHDGAEENLALVLEPLDYSQVEFYVHYDDGDIPEEVEIRIDKHGQEDTTSIGRFGKHDTGSAVTVGSGVIPPTRYRQKTGAGGLIKLTLPQGQRTDVSFAANRDEILYRADKSVTPTMGLSQEEIVLKPATDEEANEFRTGGTMTIGKLAVTLTIEGKSAEFKQVNLRKTIDDFSYRQPSTTEGNKFVWQNVVTGRWYLVAESEQFHAPYVKAVDVDGETVLSLDIVKGHLRVIADRETGTPDPSSGEARYRVRLRPMGSGTVERAYNGNLTGKQTDHIDFFIPAGEYDVRVESPENYAKLAVTPVEQTFTMTGDGEISLSYTIAAAATLKFLAVTTSGSPVPNVEYLITFHPAGEVPESERSNVEKGGYDGQCEIDIAPSGPVYVMIWSQSQDWDNPDQVFQIDLPPYGVSDLGAVVVQP